MDETKKLTGDRNHATGFGAVLPTRWIVLAIVLVLGLGLVTSLKTGMWHQLEHLQDDFAARKTEVFYLGIQLQGELERANRELMREQLSRNDPESAVAFRQRIKSARQLLTRSQASLSSPEERAAAQRLEAALDQYYLEAQALLSQGLKAVRRDSAAQVTAQIESISARLMESCQQLIQSQKVAWNNFLKASEQTAGKLQTMALLSVLLQVLLLLVVAVLLHRVWVIPLQARLSDSHARLERQEKLASLGTLAAGVAHEIRNPLTAIKFRLFSFKKALPQGLVENDDLQVIGSELNRLERITKDFLQFARPSEPELNAVPVTQLIEELRQLMGPQLERRGIQLVIEPLTDSVLRMDRQQLLQVLINLTQNAADSIEQHGKITLRARRREARQGGRVSATVIIEVSDTGKGIPPEVQKRLFDPFYSTKANGTGLGLCIAEGIINKHGGAIEFQSSPNQGTTFMLVLPCDSNHESKNSNH